MQRSKLHDWSLNVGFSVMPQHFTPESIIVFHMKLCLSSSTSCNLEWGNILLRKNSRQLNAIGITTVWSAGLVFVFDKQPLFLILSFSKNYQGYEICISTVVVRSAIANHLVVGYSLQINNKKKWNSKTRKWTHYNCITDPRFWIHLIRDLEWIWQPDDADGLSPEVLSVLCSTRILKHGSGSWVR